MRGVNWRGAAAWTAAVLAGLALGAGSAWGAFALGAGGLTERYGAWTHSRAAGSPAADPYTRAVIAREALLALSAREALYFSLDRDDEGRPLSEACIYELAGTEPQARWWSATLYAADDFLARNTDHAESIDSTSVRAGPDALWRARIAPVRGEAAHWLSSRAAGRGYSLMLRIYNPDDGWRPRGDTMPVLTTLACTVRAR